MTPTLLEELKKAYEKAVEKGEKEFKLNDLDFVTNYAKYLIEYSEEKFKREKQYREKL